MEINNGDGVKLFTTKCDMCKLPERPGGRHLSASHCITAFREMNQTLGRALEAAQERNRMLNRAVKFFWLVVHGRAQKLEDGSFIVERSELHSLPREAGFMCEEVGADGRPGEAFLRLVVKGSPEPKPEAAPDACPVPPASTLPERLTP